MGLTAFMFAALPLLGLPHAVGSLDVSDTTSAYLRGASKGAVDPSLDLDTVPAISTSVAFRRAQMRLDYAPRLTLRNVQGESRSVLVLHNAAAGIGYATPRLRLGATQFLSLGRQFFSNLGVAGVPGASDIATTTGTTAPPAVQLLPGVRSLDVRTLETQATVSYLLTPRWSTELRGSYLDAGGRTTAEQLFQPRRREGTASAGLGYQIARRHQLVSEARFAHIDVSSGYEHYLAGVGETLRSQLSPTTALRIEAGGLYRRSTLPDASEKTSFVPDGALGLDFEAVRGRVDVSFSTGGSVAPLVNSLTGQLQVSAGGQLSSRLHWHDSTLSLSADGFQSVPRDGENATRLLGGSALFEQKLGNYVALGLNARLQNQRVRGTDIDIPLIWALALGLRAQLPTLRW